jgi:hypothetical protein
MIHAALSSTTAGSLNGAALCEAGADCLPKFLYIMLQLYFAFPFQTLLS